MSGTIRLLSVIFLCAAAAASGLTASSATAQRQPPRRSAARPTPQAKPSPQAKATPQAAPPSTPTPGAAAQPTPAAPARPAPTDAGQELRLGKKALRAARAAEALVHLNDALRLYQASGNKSGQAAAHDLLGELYERQGQYEVALEHFNQALVLFEGRAAEVEKTKHAASSAAARVAPGVPDVSQAAKAVPNADWFNFNLTLSKIGNMHLRRGRPDEARASFARMKVPKPDAGVLKGKTGGGGFLKNIAKGAAVAAASGDRKVEIPVGSLVGIDAAKRSFEIYHQTILYATQEIGQGRIAYAEGRFGPAREHFEGALEVTKSGLPFVGNLGQTRRFRAAARTALGDLALEQGRYPEAVGSYRKAHEGARDDKRLDVMWPAQLGEGRALWAQSEQEKNPKKAAERRAQALEAYRAAVKTVEEIRQGSVRADEARTTFLATTKDVFDEASAAHARMALALSTPGAPLTGEALSHADQGLRLAEQGRARSLLDLLGETGSDITRDIPPDLVRRKRENLDRQNEIAAQLAGIAPDGTAPDKSVDKLEEELDDLQKEFDALENEIRQRNPRYEALTAARPLALADIQARVLDDSTTLLEYTLGADASYLWVVKRDTVALHRLPPRAEVDRLVAAVREQLVPAKLRRPLVSSRAGTDVRGLTQTVDTTALRQAAAFASASHALYKAVYEPAAALAGGSRLLVVAEGSLAYVPFEALVSGEGGEYSALPFLIKTNEIVYAPSASVVGAVREQAGAQADAAPGAVLLIADPVFDPSDPRAAGRGQTADAVADASRGLTLTAAVKSVSQGADTYGGGMVLARLGATAAEAESAAAAARAAGLKADAWLGLDASEANVATRDLTAYGVVHFATHGLLDAERPQFTGLVLSLVGGGERDGFLRTGEVFNLRLGRPLVMLSACETGLGRERRGEGVIGLTRAFMYAGAPTVGVSLWAVADRSTAVLMSDFYRRLLARDAPTPAAALRDARLKMLADARYSAPYYWAPFVLVGDWRWKSAGN